MIYFIAGWLDSWLDSSVIHITLKYFLEKNPYGKKEWKKHFQDQQRKLKSRCILHSIYFVINLLSTFLTADILHLLVSKPQMIYLCLESYDSIPYNKSEVKISFEQITPKEMN